MRFLAQTFTVSKLVSNLVLFTFVLAGFLAGQVGSARAAESPATRPADPPTFLPVPDNIREKMPEPRTAEEVRAIVGERPKATSDKPLHIVLVAGVKDHGPGEHDYPAWQKAWQKLLAAAPNTKVTTAWEKPSAEDLKSADVLVLFRHFAWPKELNQQMDAFFARGGGVVVVHFAVDAGDNGEHVGKYLGLYWGMGAKFRHGWLDLEFEDRSDLPILKGLAGRKLRFLDESYWRLTGDPESIQLLASGMEDDGDGKMIRVPLMWNREVGKGRVHVNILGHYNWSFNDPLFRILLFRGIAWAANEPVDRFAPLATVDVRLRD